ncbi:hypothetical protein, partial [Sphingomonas sp. GC_Shp_6]
MLSIIVVAAYQMVLGDASTNGSFPPTSRHSRPAKRKPIAAGPQTPRNGRSWQFKRFLIADVLQKRQPRCVTWKRLALALLLGTIALPLGFVASEAALTRWYLQTETHGDGQVGLSIFFGSLFNALICGAVVFVA